MSYLDLAGLTRVLTALKSKMDLLVPQTRKVNNKALSADITLNALDVGADSSGSASAVQANLNAAVETINAQLLYKASSDHTHSQYLTSAPVTSVAGRTGAVTLAKGDVGLGNVDNTADANKSVASAAKLTTPRTIDGISFDGSANITIPKYGTCSTAAATAAKVGTLSGFVRYTGVIVGIKFTYANTAASPTLNMNSTGAAAIYDFETGTYPAAGRMGAGTHLFQFNGSQWVLLNPVSSGGGAKIETGSYTGTGASGSSNPNVIVADFAIKNLSIQVYATNVPSPAYNGSTGLLPLIVEALPQNGTYYAVTTALGDWYLKRSVDGKTVTWYSSSAASQLNTSGLTYYYQISG